MKTNSNNDQERDFGSAILTQRVTVKNLPRALDAAGHLRPRPGTRVQQLEDGSGGLDVLFSHVEVEEHVKALNEADAKAAYRVSHIPEKPRHRKAKWDEINRKRLGNHGQN